MAEPIKIEGLTEWTRSLQALDRELPKALRMAFREAAGIVAGDAKPRVPRRSGKARASVRVVDTHVSSQVVGGGPGAPHYPWLDFGGRVGRNNSVHRPYVKDGRYIYNALVRNSDRYAGVLERALLDVAARAGIEVD